MEIEFIANTDQMNNDPEHQWCIFTIPPVSLGYHANMTELTLEFLQELLKEDYPDVTITYFEGAPGSKRGDNYTSVLYRISVSGTRREGDEETPWQGSIIYKSLPESALMREVFKSDVLFCNEVAFYNKIWPALSKFQQQWPNVKHPFKSIPKYYLAQSDAVILKDLKQQGFVMPDRRLGLTVEQSYFVLKHLSHFHALSLAMKCHSPDDFYELINVKDGISEENEEYYKNYYREAACNAIEIVEEELQDCEDKDKYLDKFRDFCKEETFFQTMVELVTPKEPLSVISHGDCWTNNFLFRCVDGDIAEMCFVDFQLARFASPALDLAFIVYLCMDRPQRDEHLSSLLEYYVDEMHTRLVEMSEADSVFNSTLNRDVLYDLMQEEFRRCSRFGLGLALDMYPIMNCDGKDAPNLYQNDVDSEEFNKHHWLQKSSETCRRKMTDLVMELVDEGML